MDIQMFRCAWSLGENQLDQPKKKGLQKAAFFNVLSGYLFYFFGSSYELLQPGHWQLDLA